jgi:hypothetical protein
MKGHTNILLGLLPLGKLECTEGAVEFVLQSLGVAVYCLDCSNNSWFQFYFTIFHQEGPKNQERMELNKTHQLLIYDNDVNYFG